MKRLKAYSVREDGEGGCVVAFATNSATARREGGNELNLSFEEVESCRRAPEFDQYAPGPVPPLVLLQHGWWFECSCCGRKVRGDMAASLENDGLDPDDFVPQDAGYMGVYCSAACSQRHWVERRANMAAKAALLEVFEARFPGATAERVHVYGQKVEPSPPREGIRCSVNFMFPGAQYGATWIYGDDTAHVARADVDAFNAWRGPAALKQGGV